MQLTEIGESRIRGYLFVLGRSLRSFLPPEVAEDAVREVESHIRERIEQVEARDVARSPAEAGERHVTAKAGERIEQSGFGEVASGPAEARDSSERAKADERAAVERVLAELGPPLRVAQAYSNEM